MEEIYKEDARIRVIRDLLELTNEDAWEVNDEEGDKIFTDAVSKLIELGILTHNNSVAELTEFYDGYQEGLAFAIEVLKPKLNG